MGYLGSIPVQEPGYFILGVMHNEVSWPGELCYTLLFDDCHSSAVDEFNHGVVLTNRPLRPGELFEVCLDRRVDKWAGSVDLGVTTHSPHAIDFPSTMTNIRSGTWIMTGNGVMHNGTTVQDEYGLNLDQLKVR